MKELILDNLFFLMNTWSGFFFVSFTKKKREIKKGRKRNSILRVFQIWILQI